MNSPNVNIPKENPLQPGKSFAKDHNVMGMVILKRSNPNNPRKGMSNNKKHIAPTPRERYDAFVIPILSAI